MANREEPVEKMLAAYWQDLRPCEECKFGDRGGMDAALSVAVEELLAFMGTPDSRREWERNFDLDSDPTAKFPRDSGYRTMERMLSSRRSRYLKPKSVEERVTRKYHPMHKCSIWLDGQNGLRV